VEQAGQRRDRFYVGRDVRACGDARPAAAAKLGNEQVVLEGAPRGVSQNLEHPIHRREAEVGDRRREAASRPVRHGVVVALPRVVARPVAVRVPVVDASSQVEELVILAIPLGGAAAVHSQISIATVSMGRTCARVSRKKRDGRACVRYEKVLP